MTKAPKNFNPFPPDYWSGPVLRWLGGLPRGRKSKTREVVAHMRRLIEMGKAPVNLGNASAWVKPLTETFPDDYRHVQEDAVRKRVAATLKVLRSLDRK
jgi:hypothetical protein